MRKKFNSLFALLILLSGCTNSFVFSEFYPIDERGWNNNQVLHFNPCPNDSIGTYNVSLVIRHSNSYRYQDIWLAVAFKEDIDINIDTIHLRLADEKGHWIGNGNNFIHTFTYGYKEGIRFSKGSCGISVKQIMKDNPLRGINNIGIVVEKK